MRFKEINLFRRKKGVESSGLQTSAPDLSVFKNGPEDIRLKAMEFYADLSFLVFIDSFNEMDFYGKKYITLKTENAEYPAQIFLDQEKKVIEKRMQKLFDQIKIYLLYAVLNELSNRLSLFKWDHLEKTRVSEMYGNYAEEYYENLFGTLIDGGDTTKISQALSKAEKLFLKRRLFSRSYGGQLWTNIASLANEMWKRDTFDTTLIDRAIQLEHNTGSVFNKNYRFFDGVYGLKQVLDANFKAKNTEESFQFFDYTLKKEYSNIPQSFSNRTKNYIRILGELNKWRLNPNSGLKDDLDLAGKVFQLQALFGDGRK
jgi:hypothetical protein